MSLTIRERSRQVADCVKKNVTQSLKSIASATEFSKSSVHRHRQGLRRRNQYAESYFWETKIGYAYLLRLVWAAVYHFGIKQGVGGESLSAFFKDIHLETHVACSPTSLRQLKQRVQVSIIDYESSQSEHCQGREGQGIFVGADETFFGLPVLVLMELSSGFIFTEVECENRTYETWLEQVRKCLGVGQWTCHGLVSDGAKALIKLALSGLGCKSIADLFHAMQALGRPMGGVLGRKVAQLRQQSAQLEEQLSQADNAKQRQRLAKKKKLRLKNSSRWSSIKRATILPFKRLVKGFIPSTSIPYNGNSLMSYQSVLLTPSRLSQSYLMIMVESVPKRPFQPFNPKFRV